MPDFCATLCLNLLDLTIYQTSIETPPDLDLVMEDWTLHKQLTATHVHGHMYDVCMQIFNLRDVAAKNPISKKVH